MATPRTRSSRVFTVSFPEPLAQQVEEIARAENRNISELLREAFREYKLQKMEEKLDAIRKSLPPTNYTADDVVDLVHEVRREIREAQKRTA